MDKQNTRKPDHILQPIEDTISGIHYKDQNGKHFVIEEFSDIGRTMYTATVDYGEPIIPVTKNGLVVQIGSRTYQMDEYERLQETPESIADNPREPTSDEKFNYAMLSRLQRDCEYYLGNGNRNPRHLGAENEAAQIEAMKKRWNGCPEDGKPEWLTMEQINEYAKAMGVEVSTDE